MVSKLLDFEEGVSTPENWFRQAWEMLEASKVLYEALSAGGRVRSEKDNQRRAGLMKGAMLLLGLSAENALKGAFVYRHKLDLSHGKLRSSEFHDIAHDLENIATKLNLDLSENQRDLLERLTTFLRWASKYQVPLKKSDQERAKGMLKLNYPIDFHLTEGMISELQKYSGFDEQTGWPHNS